MSTLGAAIRAATSERDKQESKESGLPENQQAIKPEVLSEDEEMVNLAIKVSRRQRTHWLIEAKRSRTSLTAAIIEALNARFGPATGE